jgi:hypothetical protein
MVVVVVVVVVVATTVVGEYGKVMVDECHVFDRARSGDTIVGGWQRPRPIVTTRACAVNRHTSNREKKK